MADALPSTDTVGAAMNYIGTGMRLVVLRPDSKKPVSEKGWQNAEPKGRDFEDGKNIGVQLGAKSGHLVDIDFDCAEARALSGLGCFFADLPAFRRASLSADAPGHRIVVCADAPDAVMQFAFTKNPEQEAIADLGLTKSVILELRAGKGYTVFPPSVIEGDRLVWNPRVSADVPTMAWEELRLKAGILAFAAFAAACYPPEGGRDNFCLSLAGALIHAGVAAETAEDIIAAIVALKGDNPRDRRGKAIATAEKRDAGEPVTGLPAFLENIGMRACEKRLRDWLGMAAAEAGEPLPPDAILIGRPDTHAVLAEIEEMLIAKSGRVYRRGSDLVRVSTLEEPVRDGDEIVRHAGLVELRSASPAWLAIEASRVGNFAQRSGNKIVPVAPPAGLMAMLGAVADESRFPPLRGLSMTPTLRCEQPGYDPESRLFLAFPPGMFPPGNMTPTQAEAEAALVRLAHPLRGFPFVADADRSVALSGMIAAVIRGEMRTCPLHLIDAPARGTGKTKLAEIIGIMGTGVPPSGVTHSDDGDENEKRLVAILRTGDPVILIDNVSSDLEGDFLCAMLTSETVQARILGQSERVRLSTRVLTLATGNNIRMRGDMARRAVRCRLDAHMANPDERSFDFDAVADVREARPALVTDALTVVRAFVAAGKPATVPPFGSFEDWDLVRGALVWLGHADPAETRAAVKEDDADVEEKVELLRLLHEHVGIGARFTMAELGSASRREALRTALARMLDRGVWDSRRAGRLLRRHKDVPFLGVTLRARPNTANVQEWWLAGEPEEALLDYRGEPACPF
ncbi:hypothetical protein G432_12330 [Sphingomonas sp. MM-1]|uniref:bifunctional DNA primase/polymerase n=1 Tax=Sphingomonas sp. MM-1 TaxID=745310 RepID=UPI0002C0CC04|nr:bifunctional DNA primase/polymerase [Sphingomonas sp. MM-1]AGH50187.1 hypothetical protein G432_12330 [Sphingomonas sp. MM-1]